MANISVPVTDAANLNGITQCTQFNSRPHTASSLCLAVLMLLLVQCMCLIERSVAVRCMHPIRDSTNTEAHNNNFRADTIRFYKTTFFHSMILQGHITVRFTCTPMATLVHTELNTYKKARCTTTHTLYFQLHYGILLETLPMTYAALRRQNVLLPTL
jgi:hypothetical protein